MTKIIVGDLHQKLIDAGLPVVGVALDRPGKPGISLDFAETASAEQQAQAAQIVKEYDQDTVDALKPQPVTEAEINNAKTVADLKTLLIKQHNLKG